MARWDITQQKVALQPNAATPDAREDDGAGAVDVVEEADCESFPASDPPAWNGAVGVRDAPQRTKVQKSAKSSESR
jgi:hypothetical protein